MTWRGAAGRGAGISARETERMDLTGGPTLAATEAGTRATRVNERSGWLAGPSWWEGGGPIGGSGRQTQSEETGARFAVEWRRQAGPTGQPHGRERVLSRRGPRGERGPVGVRWAGTRKGRGVWAGLGLAAGLGLVLGLG